MSECPSCGMRDDDWFLCRRDNCAVKANADALATLRSDNERLGRERDEAREYAKQARRRENAAEDARIHEQHRASTAEAEAATLREQVEAMRGALEAAEIDARRYRWLRDPREGMSNRWPSLTQYPYQPAIDDFCPPQIARGFERKAEFIDESVDAAMAAPPERLLSRHRRAMLSASPLGTPEGGAK